MRYLFSSNEEKELLSEWSAKKGVTLLVSSHDLSHVTEVCERIVVLEKGQIIKDIKPGTDTLETLNTYFKEQLV